MSEQQRKNTEENEAQKFSQSETDKGRGQAARDKSSADEATEGKAKAANSTLSGAGQQQRSGANPATNS